MPTIVWFRNDLRLHDHPALSTAAQDGEVIPVFVFDPKLLHGPRASSNRNRFLLESLQDLQNGLRTRGADLVVLHGNAVEELSKLAKLTGTEHVYCTADYTPFALKRDKAVKAALHAQSIELRLFPGRLIVSKMEGLQTKAGTPHKVFTPFYKQWLTISRRRLAELPNSLHMPSGIGSTALAELSDIAKPTELSPDALPGGEAAALRRLNSFLQNGVQDYVDKNNDLGAEGTSRMSPYLHFGCISPLYIESILPQDNPGPRAWHRQLAWREFYNFILFHFPDNARLEFQERFRNLEWTDSTALLDAWKAGQTGYPIVDAAMRQLRQEGWMHNRSRLIVGSFLTKDLGLDWRLGEAHFLQMLMDGDEANNNGNWQWITSVGVDPAPVFRRLYNPVTQQLRHDPEGTYVRRYLPELADVPTKYIAEPWTMPDDIQQSAGCIIGQHYPAPIVDHSEARKIALERFRVASEIYNQQTV
ncbi:MAG TPA: deoxyribodipyrimidine photo-lyase [Candidatus Saccharimonadales bacterium]|jgi:deoxyribodipyrimidine photo-lyase